MHPNQGIGSSRVSSHQSQMALSVQNGLVTYHPEGTIVRGQVDIGDLEDEALPLHAVSDEALNGEHLQAVPLAELLQLRQPGHAAILVHDLADHPGGIEPCQPGQVDAGLGVAGSAQNPSLFGSQGKEMARGHKIALFSPGIDKGLHSCRPIEGRDSGGGGSPGIHRYGKSGLHGLGILKGHQGQLQLIQPLSNHGDADQAPSMADHEVYGLRRRLFCRQDQVALVLPIFIVQDNDKAARLDLLYRLFYRAE